MPPGPSLKKKSPLALGSGKPGTPFLRMHWAYWTACWYVEPPVALRFAVALAVLEVVVPTWATAVLCPPPPQPAAKRVMLTSAAANGPARRGAALPLARGAGSRDPALVPFCSFSPRETMREVVGEQW